MKSSNCLIFIKNPPKFQHKNSGVVVVVDVGGLFFILDLERVVGSYQSKMFLIFVVPPLVAAELDKYTAVTVFIQFEVPWSFYKSEMLPHWNFFVC